ncbi:MAG: hypothetical protein HQM13_12935 [SAR324 cluster bacterium]|nr:hypothetical protein [SAR324 cluster bacterium]
MTDEMLKIGLPAGSLANPKRGGNLVQLLEDAGFRTSGYEAGGPSQITTSNFIYAWDGRPQEFGSQLGIGELDVAIGGDDWVRERILELQLEYNTEVALEKVLSLKRGGVKIVGIVKDDHPAQSIEEFLKVVTSSHDIITLVSEMPYLAVEWIQSKLKKLGLYEEYSKFSVQKYKTPPRINKGIVIYETWGKTEAKIKNGGADIGLEITQTGGAIRNYGLKIIETVMESEAGIWIHPLIKKNPQKLDLLKMFLLNLYGTINAEQKVLLLFNVANENTGEIEEYLKDNNLYADEPTINRGTHFTEYSVQVETDNKENPLAKIRYDLAIRKAKSIDTVPLQSSIPNLEVLQL